MIELLSINGYLFLNRFLVTTDSYGDLPSYGKFKSCEELRSHAVEIIGYFNIDGQSKYCGPSCKSERC